MENKYISGRTTPSRLKFPYKHNLNSLRCDQYSTIIFKDNLRKLHDQAFVFRRYSNSKICSFEIIPKMDVMIILYRFVIVLASRPTEWSVIMYTLWRLQSYYATRFAKNLLFQGIWMQNILRTILNTTVSLSTLYTGAVIVTVYFTIYNWQGCVLRLYVWVYIGAPWRWK
jgi:hypothetical protein